MMLKKETILVVDDEKDILFSMKLLLKQHYATIVTEENPYHLPRLIRQHEPELILLDMNFGRGKNDGTDGLKWLAKIKELQPTLPVIIMTAYSDVQLAVESLKRGAYDFIEKPWRNEKLLATLQSATKHADAQKAVLHLKGTQEVLSRSTSPENSEIIGESVPMRSVFATIEKVAVTDANVLITGENGTGKELVARALHKKSQRGSQVFIPVDLGAIPESLFESEIFGHKKGAFTGAYQDRMGRFEAAAGGTLFLDELGNLGLPSQAKLLQALQYRRITPVGSNKSIALNVRLICATNMPLQDMVREGTFRQDLLYRVNTVEIALPPLQQRGDDIVLLAEAFLTMHSKKYGKKGMQFSEGALDALAQYHWPGNVRELRHIVERAVIMSESDILQACDLSLQGTNQVMAIANQSSTLNLEEVEKMTIAEALDKHHGNISKAAVELGLTRASLYRRLGKYKM